jgi:hypothetical protein
MLTETWSQDRRQVDPREALRRALDDSGLDSVLCVTPPLDARRAGRRAGGSEPSFARSQNVWSASPAALIYFSILLSASIYSSAINLFFIHLIGFCWGVASLPTSLPLTCPRWTRLSRERARWDVL